jgi:hypothetical protein
MASLVRYLALALAATCSAAVWAQAGTEAVRPPAVLPQVAEPAPKLIAYPPIVEALARGVVIIQFRTEHLRVMPVFGKTAVEVSPHLGHLHVTVDKQAGTWAHTSLDPVIVVGLAPGPHNIVLEIADPAHRILTSETVNFVVPPRAEEKAHTH